MTSRRQFIKLSALASALFAFNKSKANELIINQSKIIIYISDVHGALEVSILIIIDTNQNPKMIEASKVIINFKI